MEAVLVARAGAIATVTLDNPDRLNALDKAMWQGLVRTMTGLSADGDLRCVVLRGAGGKAFAAGADIAEFDNERANARQARVYGALIHEAMQAVAHCRHPTLALAGRAVTLEILLEGRVFDAQEALAKGLVNRVVEDAEVEREAYAAAERIAAGAPLVARWHKQFVERLTPRVGLAPAEWDEGFACFDTADYRKGVAEFLAKRRPQFSGR